MRNLVRNMGTECDGRCGRRVCSEAPTSRSHLHRTPVLYQKRWNMQWGMRIHMNHRQPKPVSGVPRPSHSSAYITRMREEAASTQAKLAVSCRSSDQGQATTQTGIATTSKGSDRFTMCCAVQLEPRVSSLAQTS